MKRKYETPQIEVIEIEMEGALCASEQSVTARDFSDGGDAW